MGLFIIIQILAVVLSCLNTMVYTSHKLVYVRTDSVASPEHNPKDPETYYQLRYVLVNHELFFTSNTTIELLPGQYTVNESFGNITIKGIENFSLIGSNDSSSTVLCMGSGTLGLSFLNVANVSISNIHFSYCTGSEPDKSIFNNITILYYDEKTEDIETYQFGKSTLLFISSMEIHLYKVIIDFSTGIGLLVISVHSDFYLWSSIFMYNKISCLIVAANDLQTYSQNYQIMDSVFAYGYAYNSDQVSTGLSIVIAYDRVSTVEVLLSNNTVHHNYNSKGNLMIGITNCHGDISESPPKARILIYNLIIESYSNDADANKGFVMELFVPNKYCRLHAVQNLDVIIDRMHLNKSCSELNINLNKLLMQNVTVEAAPYTCEHVMSIRNSRVTLQDFKMVNSIKGISVHKSKIIFQGYTKFLRNDGGIMSQESVLTFKGNTTIKNNAADKHFLTLEDTTVFFTSKHAHTLHLFETNEGGALIAIRSEIYVHSEVIFRENCGYNGGALAMYDRSTLHIGDGVIYFERNKALNYGGAIYVNDAGYRESLDSRDIKLSCFTSVLALKLNSSTLQFTNNTAVSGSALFGGWLDYCGEIAESPLTQWPLTVFNTPNRPSEISSNPSRVCICLNHRPLCNDSFYTFEQPVFPGQTIQIEVVAVGQQFGTVPSTVIAEFVNPIPLDTLQQVQNTREDCTTLNYTVKSPNKRESLQLKVDKQFIPLPDVRLYDNDDNRYYIEQLLLFEDLLIKIHISKCPLGYTFENSSNICICQKTLTQNNIQCHSQNYTVVRRDQMWINATYTHTEEDIGNPGVIVHHNCPYDYCKYVQQQYLDLAQPDDQCSFNHTGILCGACPQHLSHVFGTSRCKNCSSLWAILVVPVFILAGIGLVALLILLNLTVTTGTINGLIFYAHIVRANHAIFFPPEMTNTFLSWFIAWLNLDLGIELCFVDGLDAYTKTWLQYLFPLYIWIMVIAIIISSHYYTTAARLSGENAVQVLATLFLMSYAKLLQVIITTFSSTTLTYPDGNVTRVWLYDGNVEYLKGKHIPLFLIALVVVVFLALPYTLVLLTIQWLQLLPSYKVLFWVCKFKPLFDAYTGIYKYYHRYWTGLLLLIRAGLFLMFSLNVLGDPSTSLLAIATTTFCLFMYLAILGGVYRKQYLNLIEYSFLLNLGVLSVATLYTRAEGNNHNQGAVIKISVGKVVITFFVIVAYHLHVKIRSTDRGKMALGGIKTRFDALKTRTTVILENCGLVQKMKEQIKTQHSACNKQTTTHSNIELRESLIVK